MATNQTKTNAVNSFENGMVTDVHPLRVDNKSMVYAKNVDFVAAGSGSQLILQKRDGTTRVKDDNNTIVSLKSGFIPISALELDNVVYIVSYNPSTSVGEIGTYPSPAYNQSSTGIVPFENSYKPLRNFHDGSSNFEKDNFNSDFTTAYLSFIEGRFVDMRLSKSYDSSVNILLTDEINPIRLINTRFAVLEDGKNVELISHRSGTGTNSYSETYFNQTELIPTSVSIPKLTFNGLSDGGNLEAGGYRYFFRYVKDDGAQTDIIEESRLVSVHQGNSDVTSYGLQSSKKTTKSVGFTLENLDNSYYGIKMYFTVSGGDADAVSKAMVVDTIYKIKKGKCSMIHTGYEPVSNYNKEELTLKYSTIRNSKTLAVSNDRLVVANTEDRYSTNSVFESLASSLQINEGTFDIYHDNTGSINGLSQDKTKLNYANSNFSYDNLGYWKGETYEIGVVFITDNGLSSVYPLQGMDRLSDTFGITSMSYPALPTNGDVFGTNGVNTKGVYRTASNGTLWSVIESDILFKGTKLTLDISSLLTQLPDNASIPGFYRSNEAMAGAANSGWYVYYEESSGQYFLRGTVTNEDFSNTARINLAETPNIPFPKINVRFDAIEITTQGRVFNRGIPNGTNLTKLYGPPVDAKSASNGFFIVRRKRIKDKLLDGIMIPVGAYPVETKGSKDNGHDVEFGYPGNWIGCGLNSVKKDNVVLAPAPSLCAAFGNTTMSAPTDELVLTNFNDNNGVPVEVTGTVIVDPSSPKYTGIPADQKVITIPLSYTSSTITNISFDKISVASSYITTGIPCTVDVSNNTITVKIIHLSPSVDKIVKGTKIFVQQAVNKLPGQNGTADIIIRAAVCDYDRLKSWALYSPDIECAPEQYSSILHDSFNLSVQLAPIEGDIQSLVNPDAFNTLLPYFTKLKNSSILASSTSVKYNSRIDYVGDGQLNTGTKSFTGLLDRVLYAWYYRYSVGDNRLTKELQDSIIKGVNSPEGYSFRTNSFLNTIFVDGVDKTNKIWEYWDGNGHRFGNAIKFGRYAGVQIDSYSAADAPLKFLNTSHSVISGSISSDNEYRTGNYFSSIKGFNNNFTDVSKYAVSCQVSGTQMSYDSWKQIYNKDTDTEYFAISRRYSYEDFEGVNAISPEIDLYGGDCYLGLSWKQVWYPKGIEEAPQATDIKTYEIDNRNMAMLNYGYVIPVPAQSNYNFNIRSKDTSNTSEFRALGKERSFIPVRPLGTSRGNRVFDTGVFNKGYSNQDMSDNRFFKLSDLAPYYKEAFANRVYVSESFQENNFVNGFTIFKGFNFRDYNSELGPIYRLITLSDKLFAIFRDGIGIIGVNERTQVSNDTGGVYVDNADVLSQKATIISTGFGSTKPNSIVSTNNYIYGVDVNRAKIWRTNGGPPEIISDVRIQTILTEILDDITSLGTDSWNDIYTTFDPFKGDVSFTFITKDRSNLNNYVLRTLIFNEFPQLNCWICETDDHRKFLNSINGTRLSMIPTPSKENLLYKYDNNVTLGGNNIFYDTQFDGLVRYSVVDDPGNSKLFENVWLAGDNPLPSMIRYMSDRTYDNGEWVTQELRPYTNVAYYAKKFDGSSYVQCTGSILTGSKTLTISDLPSMIPPGRSEILLPGDYISIENIENDGSITTLRFVIIAINGTSISVDTPSTKTITNGKLVFGYKTPLWLADSSVEDGYGKIICMGGPGFKNKPRGKWMRFELTFTGEDQIYIGAIVTTYNKSFS